MAELLKTKINKKSPKFHKCSPQKCIFKDESSKDVALQCRKCYGAVPMRQFYKSFTTNLKRIMTWQQTQQQKCCQQRQQQQQQTI